MISECINPDCRKELHYLRDGRVVRMVRSDREQEHVEHYWLCGDCHVKFDFCFKEEGRIALKRRPESLPEDRSALRLIMVA